MKKQLLLLFTFFSLVIVFAQSNSSKERQASKSSWKLVYEHDSLGRQLRGSKEHLLNSARNGHFIRVGYVINTPKGPVEHYFPATHITIFNDHIYVQGQGMSSQRWNHPDLKIWLGESPFAYHYIYSSDGHVDEAGISYETNKKVFHVQSKRQLMWYVQQ